MSRRTVGDKRGSVRGAPPDVYLAFGNLGDDDVDIIQSVLHTCWSFLKGIGIFVLVLLGLLVWLAIVEGKYHDPEQTDYYADW